MAEMTRLSRNSGWIDWDFVERERTSEPAMKLGIQTHLAGLSLTNAVSELERLDAKILEQ